MMLLAKFWPEALAGLLVIVIGGFVSVVIAQRNHARAELVICQANFKTAQMANDQMRDAALKQNASIDAFKKAAETRQVEARKAIAEAVIVAKPIEKKAAAIAAVKLSDNECNDLQSLIDEARR